MNARNIHWGIIGLGKIAHTFAADINRASGGQLYGVASRSREKAARFATAYGAERHFDSYSALCADPNIDVIYIATPHPMHFENTMMCLDHGKHVLCEKPMGMHARQVDTMIKMARSKGLFLMEGLWTRFMPSTRKVLALIKENTIGNVLLVQADFGFKAKMDPKGRLYNKELGGGSLLDIGIYPIYLSMITLGIPKVVHAMASMTQSGVDGTCAMLFGYDHKAQAVLHSTIQAKTPTVASIFGTRGTITMHARFHECERITIDRYTDTPETMDLPLSGNGYVHEIDEVQNCLRNGWTESPKLPLDLSLQLITVMDRVRNVIGLTYPADSD